MALLDVRKLVVCVRGPQGTTTIVDGVSFSVPEESAVALVGESGSGKSLTAFSVIGLLPPGARIDRGSIQFDNRDLVTLRDREMRRIRGARIAMVFQEPSTALNPVYTIGSQIVEAVRLHRDLSSKEARALAEHWLGKVGMPSPSRAFGSYPHELSGGMKQRALLAMALVAQPALLIADEPTSSLDRTLEAQILDVVMQEREARKMGVVLVSHDLATVAEVTDRVVVMYAGQVVEERATESLVRAPAHPYTQALIASIPNPSAHAARKLGAPGPRLPVLGGAPPRFDDLPPGCRFAPRCPRVFDRCTTERPPLYPHDEGTVRCFLYAGADEASDEDERGAA
ncbi:MAG: ABC transporter ATP-binding protein [Polyangiaceae bacterium]|nr:ABC transporter ATP-binding protein [Polyangiaceae bacterium]